MFGFYVPGSCVSVYLNWMCLVLTRLRNNTSIALFGLHTIMTAGNMRRKTSNSSWVAATVWIWSSCQVSLCSLLVNTIFTAMLTEQVPKCPLLDAQYNRWYRWLVWGLPQPEQHKKCPKCLENRWQIGKMVRSNHHRPAVKTNWIPNCTLHER